MNFENFKEKYDKSIKKELEKSLDCKNIMSIPKLEKIVINRGLGEVVSNSKVVEYTFNQFIAITGQKPLLTRSKKAISNFKIRKDQVLGCKVTLRSQKMYDFFTKLVNIVLPKIRDFRGVPFNSFDGKGNYTLAIKEDRVFSEITTDIDKARGLDITFVTNTNSDNEAFELLKAFGMPFRKK